MRSPDPAQRAVEDWIAMAQDLSDQHRPTVAFWRRALARRLRHWATRLNPGKD